MDVMARTLWNEDVDFDALARDYFAAAFGAAGEAAREYLARLSQLFDPPYLRGDRREDSRRDLDTDSHVWILDPSAHAGVDEEAAQRLGQIPALIDSFRPAIEANLALADPCHARSWQYLAHHAEITLGLARAFKARAEGQLDLARSAWDQVADMAWRKEDALQPVLDVFEFVGTLGSRFR